MTSTFTSTYFTFLPPDFSSSTLTTETSPPLPSIPVFGTNSLTTSPTQSSSARTSVASAIASASGSILVKSGPVRARTVVGAVIGGLALGVIISVSILLFLYRRRNRSRNNLNTVYVQDNAWQNERKQLVDKLNAVEADRARLRTTLQINDAQDSREIVEAFQRLNVSIRNLSMTTSSAILKSVKTSSSEKTHTPSNLAQLQTDLAGATGLVLSDTNTPRSPQDFLAEAFRFVINSALEESLFRRFHPFVSQNENELLTHSYQQIRSHDEQRLSARWRCSTYTAVDSRYPATIDQEWSKLLADNLFQRFTSIVTSLFGDEAKDVLPKNLHEGLSAIGREAFGWNKTTKTTFMSLDFRPVVFTSASPFDPASMALYQNHTPKESPPRTIICGVSMGLMSTVAVVSGDVVREEVDWQAKADVVTGGFF